MISKVIIEQGLINVYDEDDMFLSSLEAFENEIAGVAPQFYVLCNKKDNLIQVYSPFGELLSSMEKGCKIVMTIIENTIIIKNELFIESYDRRCTKLYINNSVSALNILRKQALKHLKANLSQHVKELNSLKSLSVSLKYYEHSVRLLPIVNSIEKLIVLCQD